MKDVGEAAEGVEDGDFYPYTHAWWEREMRENQAGPSRSPLAPGEEAADEKGAG